MTTPKNKVVFSGIQPSGTLHIGNYLGAIKQWIALQTDNTAYYCIVDEHAITAPYDPDKLPDQVLDTAAHYLAAGVDPERSTIFVQSHVSAHTKLAWLLGTVTRKSELERMRQFWTKRNQHNKDPRLLNELIMGSESAGDAAKRDFTEFFDKNPRADTHDFAEFFLKDIQASSSAFSAVVDEMDNHETELLGSMLFQTLLSEQKNASFGLFAYPVLQAADILLYQTELVPVGEDQLQHIELTRDIAKRFNNKFGSVFALPEALVNKSTARIMSLTDPTKKMSKSDDTPKSYIALSDSPDEIRKKISSAVTETEPVFSFTNSGPAVKNLLAIFQAFSGQSNEEIEKQFASSGYKEFKSSLADLLIQHLSPIQERFQTIRSDTKHLQAVLADGATKAAKEANKTLKIVHEKMGLL